MATICKCANCGVTSKKVGGDVKCPLYCKDCSTEAKREAMKKENEEIQIKK